MMERDPHDDTLSRALHDVAIPAGLADRLLLRLSSEVVDAAPNAEISEAVAEDKPGLALVGDGVERGGAAVRRRRWSRWMFATGGGALVATLTVVFLIVRMAPQAAAPASPEQLAAAAITWHEQVTSVWHEGHQPVPAGYEQDRHVRARQPRWQSLATAWDRHAIVYELADDGHAWLYVQHASPEFLADGAPSQRLPSTGGWSVGAWRRGNTLYVVTTHDRFWRLEDFIEQQSRSLASQGLKSRRFAG